MADDDEWGWLTTLIFGAVLTPIGGWLALNGSGVCIALHFSNSCLIGGQTFGILGFLFGVLLLWAGYDDFTKGKDAF